ncbi:DUF1156 domain-containing protein [Halovivax cerinus]|uniref:DUF1156 domain-containing protein n=1 Tax=Halovivax cerinus TaxID=1487865 RepID=A0ABD5NQC1_9EURY|nr:DUF1156 domain-containing protein [Halovivax cerinus]
MSEQPAQETDEQESLKPLAIEGKLPLKAVGIENLKEANPKHMPPHRYLHPWFARRPTPATRLAILASVFPKNTDPDDLLRWMQIGPKEGVEDESISEYVERKKANEQNRDGNLEGHYGYPRPFTSSPNDTELETFHESLRKHWDGSLPEIIDPTAGGGVIPFESLRYGLPTKANELNPVPSLILKVLLQYAPKEGSLEEELIKWSKTIDESAEERLREYFPSGEDTATVDSYVTTHTIGCPTCGSDLPLVSKWSIRTRKSADTVITKPDLDESGSISYDCLVEPDQEILKEFDHSDGPVSRGGDAECLQCGVVTESEAIQERYQDGEFRFDVYCVREITTNGEYKFRAPNDADQKALTKAKDRIESDYQISSFLSTEVPEGEKTREPREYGVTEWKNMYTPRQIVSHYEYLQSFREHIGQIQDKYSTEKAEAILAILSLAPGKLIDYNSRFSPWHTGKGYPSNAMGGKHFSLAKSFADINMSVGGMGSYQSAIEKIIESYEILVRYLPGDVGAADVVSGDAAKMPFADGSVDAAIMDPPYYSSIMYAELSDMFYVILKPYLKDTLPNLFSSDLTDKMDEAVANPSKFATVASNEHSKKELADQNYEDKMGDIFSEVYRVLDSGGVMTVMFTHKETDAWDTLTMSLINSGFTITSTHPITSEMPARIDTQGTGSADSTLLLVGRKPHEERDPEDTTPTLWSDVKTDTRTAAQEAARDLIDSGLSLTKTDVIISAFGPTLRVFADAYPVVDDEDNEVKPRRALEEAREAVTRILIDEYLEVEGIDDLDDITEWYVLCWLVHEKQTFSYDDGHQLGLGIGVDIDDIKRNTKTWRKSTGDISLRGHADRVQNSNEKPENRSSRTPVNPDDLSFGLALDKVHAAMHIYDVQGESACCDWLRERNFDSDSTFKSTLKALLQVLPHDHDDWELARDLAVGRTRDVLDLEFSPNVFADDGDKMSQSKLSDH